MHIMAGNGANSEELKQKTGNVLGIVQVIGSVVSVIILMAIGIKYMLGSVEEKANIKNSLIAYIAGCVVVFGAFTIWKIVVTILQSAPTA